MSLFKSALRNIVKWGSEIYFSGIKRFKHWIGKATFYLRTSDASYFLIFSIIVGLGGGFGAILFRWMIGQFDNLFFGQISGFLGFMGRFRVLLLPALGGLLVGPLTYYFAREAIGHGVP